MIRPIHARVWALKVWFSACLLVTCLGQTNAPPRPGEALLLSAQGSVEVLKAGLADWHGVRVGMTLRPGDRLRTGPASRAELRVANMAVLPVAESSALTIEAPSERNGLPILNFQNGSFSFFGRDKSLNFRTKLASGATRGTEFHLSISDAQEVLTVLEGAVDLEQAQNTNTVAPHQEAVLEPGKKPVIRAVLEAVNRIQWVLYYPAVLDLSELDLAGKTNDFAASIRAYSTGDIVRARETYPTNREPASDVERIYLAAISLSVGSVVEAQRQLEAMQAAGERDLSLARSLRTLIAAVKLESLPTGPTEPTTSSELLALSYYEQAYSKLEAALKHARAAVQKDPRFGFGWARVADLEFSFGRRYAALQALEKALQLTPNNAQAIALKGFLLAADGKISKALETFDQALALDSALPNAWVGRGLCRIRKGDIAGGREDLEVAASLEPQRGVFRSYLGKAFATSGELSKASHELAVARVLDKNDPTAWLYSALVSRQQNRINEAIRELERAQDLNENRSVFRSEFLLDQDRAVRSANLAAIYQEAGMYDVSVREAQRSLSSDYANYSAHLFLANSYSALSDPHLTNLRYETPAESEYLIANLLAPAGAGVLSQNLSQMEYSRLFEQNHFGLVSGTEYRSTGDWLQYGSQYGRTEKFSYSVEALHRSEHGQRPNADLEQNALNTIFKQQITASDTLFANILLSEFESGDLSQTYANKGANLRVQERQEPIFGVGLHHQWTEQSHTLFFLGRMVDTAFFDNHDQVLTIFARNTNGVISSMSGSPRGARLPVSTFDLRSDLEIYTTELQQIWEGHRNTIVAGGRFQSGTIADTSTLSASNPVRLGTEAGPAGITIGKSTFVPFPAVSSPALGQQVTTDMERVSLYAYDTWRLFDPVRLTGGIAYDRLHFPSNHLSPPLSANEEVEEKVSPKAGFVWDITKRTTLRGSYTRSLGGVSFDQSFRLEPTQVGGFNQAYRSLISESVAGPQTAPAFETFGLGLDHKFPTGTYLGVESEWLNSDARRTLGSFNRTSLAGSTSTPSFYRDELDYHENNVLVTVDQLLGEYFSVGARYRISQAHLEQRTPDLAPAVSSVARQDYFSTMHQLDPYLLFNHPCGFFAGTDWLWVAQQNGGAVTGLRGDNLWQQNLFGGYRFFQRHAEVRLAVLNINNRDYNLFPLTFYSDLPRKRTFVTSLRWSF